MHAKTIVLRKIKEYQTIIIHGHTRPDGDCYGSQFGLKDIISNSFPEKNVYVVGEKSDYVDFIGQIDVVKNEVYQDALSIVVDTATESRISDRRYRLAKEVIKIDHHIPSEDSFYADYYWVDVDKPSCSQMIAEFYNTYKKQLKLTYQGALAMYTGMVTDTGGFRYRGVNRKTHEIAGMLLEFGVEVEHVDYLLSIVSMEQIKLKGYILSHFETTKNGFIYFVLTKEIIKQFNLKLEAAAASVSYLAGIEGYPVWALFVESDDEIRIRLRSNGPEIESIARKYGGGGHDQAAGARVENFAEIKNFVQDVDDHIKKYRDQNEVKK